MAWNHWTQSGWVTSGRIGQSKWMGFDGSDDYIDLWSTSIVDVATDNYTFVVKFKSNDNAANKFLIWKENCRLRIDWTVEWAWYDWDTNSYLNSPSINTWQWYTAAIVVDQSVWHTLYLDWVKVDSSTETWDPNSSTKNFSIWALNPWSAANFFNWMIDYWFIFNQALSPKQIEQLYYATYN